MRNKVISVDWFCLLSIYTEISCLLYANQKPMKMSSRIWFIGCRSDIFPKMGNCEYSRLLHMQPYQEWGCGIYMNLPHQEWSAFASSGMICIDLIRKKVVLKCNEISNKCIVVSSYYVTAASAARDLLPCPRQLCRVSSSSIGLLPASPPANIWWHACQYPRCVRCSIEQNESASVHHLSTSTCTMIWIYVVVRQCFEATSQLATRAKREEQG
jgi:hypothetical protein